MAGQGEEAGPGETGEDRLFAGQIRLRQFRTGHRAGTDAILLAAMTPRDARRIADLGAGTGIVGLRAAQINPEARVTLVEREPDLAELAGENAQLNGLAERVEVLVADVTTLGRRSALRDKFDCVLSNPPFRDAAKGRASPDALRARAHVIEGGLDGWVRAAAGILTPDGTFAMIHRADAIGDILAATGRRFGGMAIRFIHPRAGEAAIRVLVSGTKGSRAPPAILPPLVLAEEDGAFTATAARLHRGETRIVMEAGG